MSCKRFRELLSARRDGELAPGELAELEEHLRSCRECRSFAGDLERLGTELEDRLPEQLPRKIERAILAETTGSGTRSGNRPAGFMKGYYRVPRGLAWVTALVLIVLLINQLFEPFSEDSPKRSPVPAEDQPVQRIVLTQKDIVSTYHFREASVDSNGGY